MRAVRNGVSQEKQAWKTLGLSAPSLKGMFSDSADLSPQPLQLQDPQPPTNPLRTSSLWSNWGITIATRPDRMGVRVGLL